MVGAVVSYYLAMQCVSNFYVDHLPMGLTLFGQT